MKFTLKDNQWEISYTDSHNNINTFYHPTEVLNLLHYTETGERVMRQITEEVLNQMFPSDSKTEETINYMKDKNIVFGDSDKVPHPLIN